MIENKPSVHYINYLDLDKILSAQNPLSGEGKEAAHDEMLFIIIHQTYELWFKQIIHEIDSVMDLLKKDKIDEETTSQINEIVESSIPTTYDIPENHVLVSVRACGINPFDAKYCLGDKLPKWSGIKRSNPRSCT